MHPTYGRSSTLPVALTIFFFAVLVLEDSVVVKTVMHHFSLEA